MIVIVPIALVVPAMLVFIPPAMVLAPALFQCFALLVPFVLRLPAIASVMFDRLVQVEFCRIGAGKTGGPEVQGSAAPPFAETRKIGLAPILFGAKGWPARSNGPSDHWYVSVKLSRYTLYGSCW